MIKVTGLSRSRGARVVLDRLSWEFPSGSCTYIQAPNGTGKTTLLRCMLGLESHSGSVSYGGERLGAARGSIAALFEDAPLYPRLSVRQNLRLFGGPHPDGRAAQVLLPRGDLLSRRLAKCSSGERKRVALAACLATGPKYVLLDEVDTGIDVDMLDRVGELIADLRGVATVILTGHNPDFYRQLAGEVVVLRDGRIESDD